MIPETRVEILDRGLNRIAILKSLAPLNKAGMILRYSGELSNYGSCMFRVSPLDPALSRYGDILEPHKYHIRLMRGNLNVWQGAIVDNTHRNKNYIEVLGHEYEFYMDHILIKRTSAVGYGEITPTADVGLHYRIFSSGTMAQAVTNVLTEFKATLNDNHILKNMVIGEIENPDFPDNFADSLGNPLTGPWTFSPDVVLQFDYQTVLYLLRAFGIYASADFNMGNDLVLDFKKFYGNKHLDKSFVFGEEGNIIDFDTPRSGKRMINDLFGIAAQVDGTILHSEKTDEASIADTVLMQGVQAFSDVKSGNALTARIAEQLRLSSTADTSPMNLLLDELSYPVGEYGKGDIVNAKIDWGAIHYKAPRRIIGYTIAVHGAGREYVTLQTNDPRPQDLGA